jgi:hypothetical protein
MEKAGDCAVLAPVVHDSQISALQRKRVRARMGGGGGGGKSGGANLVRDEEIGQKTNKTACDQ